MDFGYTVTSRGKWKAPSVAVTSAEKATLINSTLVCM